jgi:hypothetical protein
VKDLFGHNSPHHLQYNPQAQVRHEWLSAATIASRCSFLVGSATVVRPQWRARLHVTYYRSCGYMAGGAVTRTGGWGRGVTRDHGSAGGR